MVVTDDIGHAADVVQRFHDDKLEEAEAKDRSRPKKSDAQ